MAGESLNIVAMLVEQLNALRESIQVQSSCSLNIFLEKNSITLVDEQDENRFLTASFSHYEWQGVNSWSLGTV